MLSVPIKTASFNRHAESKAVHCDRVDVTVLESTTISSLIFLSLAEASICGGRQEASYVVLNRVVCLCVWQSVSCFPAPTCLCSYFLCPSTCPKSSALRCSALSTQSCGWGMAEDLGTTWEIVFFTDRVYVKMQLDVWHRGWIKKNLG